MYQTDANQPTFISRNLSSPSKIIENYSEKSILNEHNSNLILTKQNLSNQSNSISDYIDWTNNQTDKSSTETIINNQLDAIKFLQQYLENGNSDILIDLLHEIAQRMYGYTYENQHSYSALNNNHLPLISALNSNLHVSNNKERKNK